MLLLYALFVIYKVKSVPGTNFLLNLYICYIFPKLYLLINLYIYWPLLLNMPRDNVIL